MRRILACLMLAATLSMSACGGLAKTSFVKASDAALGRVVVYRNGIAYYERRARILGEKLTLKVPGDKVDDFLKSLTVADAATGRALPVSFPTGNVGYSGTIDMSIQLGLGGPRDVILSYVTEAPAWKPSYRLVIGESGKVNLNFADPFVPQITTMRINTALMGQIAADMILSRIRRKPDDIHVLKIKQQLVDRGSCRRIDNA